MFPSNRFCSIAIAAVVTCGVQLGAAAANISVSGKDISISDANFKQIDKVKNLGVTVYYPAFVPARYSLHKVTLSDSFGDNKHLDYSLEFCDKKRVCFSVESAYCGIGDAPDGDKILHGKSKNLGPFNLNIFLPQGKQRLYYLSDWQPDKKMQSSLAKKLEPPKSEGRFYHFLGYGVTDKEAMAIAESLSPVK